MHKMAQSRLVMAERTFPWTAHMFLRWESNWLIHKSQQSHKPKSNMVRLLQSRGGLLLMNTNPFFWRRRLTWHKNIVLLHTVWHSNLMFLQNWILYNTFQSWHIIETLENLYFLSSHQGLTKISANSVSRHLQVFVLHRDHLLFPCGAQF